MCQSSARWPGSPGRLTSQREPADQFRGHVLAVGGAAAVAAQQELAACPERRAMRSAAAAIDAAPDSAMAALTRAARRNRSLIVAMDRHFCSEARLRPGNIQSRPNDRSYRRQ